MHSRGRVLYAACGCQRLLRKFLRPPSRQLTLLPTLQAKTVSKARTKSPAPEEHLPKENLKVCNAFCTAKSYDFAGLKNFFANEQHTFSLVPLPKDAVDVMYVSKKPNHGEGEIFLFRRLGAFVCWDISDQEMQVLRELLAQHQVGSYPDELVTTENEQLNYYRTPEQTALVDGEIYLKSTGAPGMESLEKFAFSNAMALSVKLAMWESSLDSFVDSMRHIPITLQEGQSVLMSRKQALSKIGELLSLRHQINLYSDLLMTPDFYWDRETLEHLYNKTCNYLEIGRRTKVMNEKMHLCSEMVEMIRSHLNERHSHRLEWMIIVLIAIEILFEVIRLAEKHA